jgi:hypothetical protein
VLSLGRRCGKVVERGVDDRPAYVNSV